MKTIGLTFILIGLASSGSTLAQDLTEAQIDSIERAAYGNEVRNLQELVVTADTPLVKVEGNRISYDVDNDPSSAGQSALDMLRKVPMVAVDGQDNITLIGESNYKIYVNGRPDPTLSANASTILKAMPASAISKVEVISDPGAKYDAEGTAGIINLVTERKRREDGYNASVTLALTNREAQAGINATVKRNRFTLNANVNYMNNRPFSNPGSYDSRSVYSNGDILVSSADSPRKFDYTGAGLSGSWEVTTNDLFNFSANFTHVGGDLNLNNNRSDMYSISGNRLWGYSREAVIKILNNSVLANTAWQHTFNRPDHYLSLSYQFDFGKSESPMDETFGEAFNYTFQYLAHQTTNTNYNRTHTVQLDYSNALSDHITLETGAKGIFRHNDALSGGEGSIDLVTFSPIEEEHTDMLQLQNIYAIYALYRGSFGAWATEAGVRYEHTRMGIRYHYGNLSDFTNNLNDVVPNAGITYSFSPAHAISLNYGMRISRPSIEQVNPYRFKYTDVQIMQGNPDLRSERINKVSLGYRNFGRLFGTSLSLDYNHTGNAISGYSYLEDGNIITTNANIGRKENVALNIFFILNVSPKVRLNFSGMGDYTYLYAGDGLKLSNHGWSGNINHNGEWTMPANLSLSWYGGYRWGMIGLQTKSGNFFYYGITLSRDFLSDKSLRLALTAANFAQKDFKFDNYTFDSAFTSRNTYRMAAWRIGLSITWNFGTNRAGVKTVNSKINNDDLSKGGASSPAASSTGAAM